jgi:S1-C subfamily serine protease
LLTDFSKAAQDMSKKLRKKVLEQIKHGPTQKPAQNKSLGVTSRTALLEYVPGQCLGIEVVIYGSDCNSGAVVTSIAPGSPADKRGQVFTGDVIIVSQGHAAVDSRCTRSLLATPVVRVTHFGE